MCGLSFKFLSNNFNSEILFMSLHLYIPVILKYFPNFFLHSIYRSYFYLVLYIYFWFYWRLTDFRSFTTANFPGTPGLWFPASRNVPSVRNFRPFVLYVPYVYVRSARPCRRQQRQRHNGFLHVATWSLRRLRDCYGRYVKANGRCGPRGRYVTLETNHVYEIMNSPEESSSSCFLFI